MQGINENIADIITQLQMQKEQGGVVVVKKGVCVCLCNMDPTKVVR